jgi:phosphoglycerol geranylgeranyltransferase
LKESIEIYNSIASRKGQIAVLIDPDKCSDKTKLSELLKRAKFANVDFLFVGGSTVSQHDFIESIEFIKQSSSIPLVIFPGASHQISNEADALLYLSLISGRNPDFLIGHHVQSAQEVFEMDIEVIPTAYILIDGGSTSSVAYVSQTTPIPSDHHSIIMNTAKAGVLQGKKLIYLDAGSGAKKPIPSQVISRLQELNKPVIVGGGIKTREKIESLKESGANVIVIGNQLEENIEFLLEIEDYIKTTP